ncbi:MAG: hypothetical protein ABS95_02715 [Verrucomicrobia bacterium SCN 57-15]|nr:MAG: hypothetical protein ABS95_02715 [Verrucomicrobia bacterium SCN 57-15]
MKALSVTPSRWFKTLFEVPVIRRIPHCCHDHTSDAQAKQNLIAHLRRRRRRCPFPVDRCRSKQGFIGQTV